MSETTTTFPLLGLGFNQVKALRALVNGGKLYYFVDGEGSSVILFSPGRQREFIPGTVYISLLERNLICAQAFKTYFFIHAFRAVINPQMVNEVKRVLL